MLSIFILVTSIEVLKSLPHINKTLYTLGKMVPLFHFKKDK